MTGAFVAVILFMVCAIVVDFSKRKSTEQEKTSFAKDELELIDYKLAVASDAYDIPPAAVDAIKKKMATCRKKETALSFLDTFIVQWKNHHATRVAEEREQRKDNNRG